MRKSLKIVAAVLSLAMAMAPAALTGCNPDAPSDNPPVVQPGDVKVTGVTLTAAGNKDTLLVGGTLQLTATVAPANATNKNVSYSSSDNAVATVSASGLVTGVAAGSVTITVTTADGNKTANLSLTVTAEVVKATGVTVASTELLFAGNLAVGGTVSLKGEVAPANATDKTLTWSSGNPAAATVSESGLVTGVGAGTAVIKATANDGSGVYGEYTVTVFAAKSSFSGENAALKGCSYNSAEQCVGGITAGATMAFTIISENAQAVALQLDVAVVSEQDASYAKQFASVTVGETTVQPESDGILCGTSYGWANHGIVVIKDVPLAAGENKIVITAAENVATNLFSLAVFGESVTEKIFVPETPITEGNKLYFEGEDAVINGSGITVKQDDAGARNSTSLQGINNNYGATLTYKFDVAENCRAGLYLNLAFGGQTVSGIFTLTVNGTEVAIPGSFTAKGTANWVTFEEYWLANVDLKANEENVIVLTVTGGCGNYDYMKLVGEDLAIVRKVTDVTLSAEGGKDAILVGESLQLTATLSPANADNKNVTYSTSAPAVATVSESGLVTGVGEGAATITVTTADGNKTATFTVTVQSAEIKVTGITLSSANNQNAIYESDSLQLTSAVAPDEATNKEVTWSSSDTAVATVSADGLVTGVSAGTAVIKATANDGSGIFGEFTVTVKRAVTSSFSGENATLKGCFYNANEQCIGGITAGATIEFTILSEHAQTVFLTFDVAVTSAADASFAKQFASVTVGGTAVQPQSDAIACSTNYGWANHGIAVIRNVQLVAGENKIVITASNNPNTNLFSLSVSGDYAVTEKVNVPDAPITEGTAYYYEGEDAVINGSGISVKRDDAGARNSTSLQGINDNKGATLTYTVNAAAACTAGLYLNLAFGGQTVNNIFTLTVNGTEAAIPGSFTAKGTANWATFEEYWLANVDLKAGKNVIVLTVTGGCGNYDYMKLVTDGTLTVPDAVTEINLSTEVELLKTGGSVTLAANVLPAAAADKSLTWSSGNTAVATVDANGIVTAVAEGSALITATANDGSGVTASLRIFVSDRTGTRYEAEEAQLTNCQKEPNGLFVGGINQEGAKVTFTVNSDSERKVLFRISTSVVREGENSIDCFFTATLNGKPIDLSLGTFASRGAIGWNTESGFFTVEITLAAGNNVIELCSVGTGVATTLDWIEII